MRTLSMLSLSLEYDVDSATRYWGQNSYGAAHSSDTANFQKPLAFYCQVRIYEFLNP